MTASSANFGRVGSNELTHRRPPRFPAVHAWNEPADDPPLRHVQHAVGIEIDFRHLVRDQDDRKAALGEFGDDLENAGARADIDADGRRIENEQLRIGRQPFGDGNALLVAAGQGRDRIALPADLDAEIGDPSRDQLALAYQARSARRI